MCAFIYFGLVDWLLHYPMKAIVTVAFTSCHTLWWTTTEPVQQVRILEALLLVISCNYSKIATNNDFSCYYICRKIFGLNIVFVELVTKLE